MCFVAIRAENCRLKHSNLKETQQPEPARTLPYFLQLFLHEVGLYTRILRRFVFDSALQFSRPPMTSAKQLAALVHVASTQVKL